MKSEFDELKRFAIADILSVSGRQKTTETVDMHINTIIDIAFLKGQKASQSKVDELQYKAKLRESDHQALLVKYQATKKCWEDMSKEKDELQKRVDAAKQLIEDLNKCYQQDHQNKFEYWRGFADSAGILGKRLEQALKGGNE